MRAVSLTASTVAEVLDRTFRIYRDNFMQFFGVVALINVPLLIISTPITNQWLAEVSFATRVGRFPDSTMNVLLISIVTAFLQGVIINGLLTYIASENLFGAKVSVFQALRACQGRFIPLALGLILYGIVVGAFTLLTVLLTAFCGLVVITFVAVVYIALASYFFLVPILILEDVGASLGLSRAWTLGKIHFWPTMRALLLIGVIGFVINLAFTSLVSLFVEPVRGANMTGGQIFALFVSIVIPLILTPLQPIAMTLMYYDARVRLEGLDLSLQTLDSPEARPHDLESPQPTFTMFTNNDFRNMFILFGMIVAFYAALFAVVSLSTGTQF